MAGRGSRLRPHTLTIPKPLLPIAGKPIVQRLVEDIIRVCNENVEEIAFIIGDFGKEVEEKLIQIGEKLGSKVKIYYQTEPLGTAHAILCAKESLKNNCIVAFADTLFKADFILDKKKEGIVWVNQIQDPSSFGVVKLNDKNIITDFIEKPEVFVSDLAIIGIYYFKDGQYLKKELQYLLDNDIKEKGEYQLTNALENMKKKGTFFYPGKVMEWLDCGNKKATIYTNSRILKGEGNLISKNVNFDLTEIIPPCYVADGVTIKKSKIGPYVSIGKNTEVVNSVIKNSIIQEESIVSNSQLNNSMIGNRVIFDGKNILQEVSIGDFSELK